MCLKTANQFRRERNARYDAKRQQEKPWRRWYQSEAWKQLRALRLKVEPNCRECGGRADTAHHVQRHGGNRVLFFSFQNTASLCKRCHDSIAQQKESLGYSTRLGSDGYPLDRAHPFYNGD